jgi:hypothetical protein
VIAVTFDYTEVLKLATDMDILAEKWFPMAMRGAVTEASLFFEREAKIGAPVDTGRLEASIGHGPDGVWEETFAKGVGYWVTVGTNVEYAPYMEYGFTMGVGHVAYIKGAKGFRYVHPFTFEGYHFMQKAANVTERMLGDTIAKHIDRAIAKGGW